MLYRNYEALNGFAYRGAHFIKALRRTFKERHNVHQFRRKATRCTLHALTETRPLAPEDVPLLMAVRDEVSRLPPFLAHYRRLGVTRFIVVDDGSTDGTREYLSEHRDVDVFTSAVRFGEARHGTAWMYGLVRRYGTGRWYLAVDVDEYLVYQGMETHPLPDLFETLAKLRHTRALAPMVDLLPDRTPVCAHFDPTRWPWEVAPYLYPDGFQMRLKPTGPVVEGGPLTNLFGTHHLLQKYPVAFWDENTIHYPDIHNLYPFHRSTPRVFSCLLHFKVFSDLADRARVAITDKQHVDEARRYKRYYERIANGTASNARLGRAIRFDGPQQLVDLGLMEGISW